MKLSQKLKKPCSSAKLILQEIIGLTTRNANGLASASCSSKCVYLAGCVVVVYDVDASSQSHLVVSHRMPKALSCVAVSQNGRFVAAGETSNLSSVLIWDCDTLGLVAELKGHLYGAQCLSFSPNGDYLVSVGGYIYLWDWRKSVLLAKVKASSTCSDITSVAFSSNGRFIVTSGNKHLKYWTVGSFQRTRSNKVGSLAIHGKPTDSGFQKRNSFVSVISANRVNSSGSDERAEEVMSMYALTDAGVLMLMSCDMLIKKSVDLKVEKCFALSASSRLIACACSEGAIQLFTPETLEYAATIHFSDARKSDTENHSHSDEQKNTESKPLVYPDAVACQFSTTDKLVVIYGDHSLYVWDVNDVNKPTRCSIMISHSAGIWDIKNLSCGNMHSPTSACVARGCCEGVSFATCSEDGTIRLWDLDLQMDLLQANGSNASESETQGTMHLASAGIFERDLVETCGTTYGFRALAVSENGKYLAAGDCGGNLHIYDLLESEYTCFTDAHEAEIQSLSFSFPGLKDVNCQNASSSEFLLASGGKGGAIHVYDVKRNFDHVGSVCGSAAVKSVKFACNGRKILTSGSDRLHLFDVVRKESNVHLSPSKSQSLSQGTIHDMAVDPASGLVVTLGQDKKINIFDIESGKLVRSFKQNRDHGDPIKVILDPSCSYLACSYSDRTICLLDFITGELVAQATGHGEAVNGVIFLPDCKHIISVAGDGCIFVWKLPLQMVTRMIRAVNENGTFAPVTVAKPTKFMQIVGYLEEDNPDADQMQQLSPWTSSFKFSVSRLPKWAQAKVETYGIATICKDSVSSQKHEDKALVNAVNIAEECSSSNLECQTPKQGSRTGKSCLGSLSKSSSDSETSVPQGDAPSHRKETRWNTIYNVCLDLLNSPNIQTSSIKQQKPENFCTKPSAEQGDMLKQFDNSLSMIDEVEVEKTSQQRRYSTQFVLRKDYIGGTRQFLRTPCQKSGYKTLRSIQEHHPLDTVNDQSSQSSEERSEQDKASSEVFHDTLADDSLQERITSCRQALQGLKAAASVFVQSMSELSTASPRDRISGELRAQLFDEAALMIPEMSQKVNEVVAKMMLEHKSRTQTDG